MQQQESLVCTAIDIGSNTIRVVVARCLPAGLDILASDEALVRIGESVNASGAISDEKLDLTITVLRQFQLLARQHSSQITLAIATEAIRKAVNQEAFIAAVKDATGITIHCIGGDVESVLTFYGATYALKEGEDSSAPIGVMDLGGGSTELILARQRQISWHTSLPIGSGWLHDRYLTADPPTYKDSEIACAFLRTYLRGLAIKRFPALLYVTGGTANTLLLLAQRAFGFAPTTTDGACGTLSYVDLVRCEGLLWALSAQEISQRYQIDRQRAPILAAGVLVLHSVMELFGLSAIHVTTNGIREGLALAYARYGDDWLAQVQQAAQIPSTKSTQSADQQPTVNPLANMYDERFVDAGLRMFHERAKTMFGWRAAVIHNEDVEAVHKMRVASRRLRAVMDAYRGIADPRIFKSIYGTVTRTADVLGAARDTDVMIEHLQDQLPQFSVQERAGIQWLIDRLGEYRQGHQQMLVAYLKKLDEADMMHQLEECLRRGL
jgi:Exopolyphosphatase